MRVLIAGGGVGGLALAIALRSAGTESAGTESAGTQSAGAEVVVVEASATATDRGSGLVLAPNGMKAVGALGEKLAAAVRAAGSPAQPGEPTLMITRTGRVLSRVSLAAAGERYGARPVSLRRAALLEALLTAAESAGVQVRAGTALADFAESETAVRAVLSDGTTVAADVLVGADGIRSTVRRLLLDDGPPAYRGITSVRGRGPLPAGYPQGFIGTGRGLQVFASPIGGGEAYWVATVNAPAGAWPALGPDAAHRELTRLLADWLAPVRAMVAAASDILVTDIYDRDPVTRWTSSRVALLGDAAHPMVPTLGQGANMALEDAVVLGRALDARPVATALRAYEGARVARTAKVVRQSRMIGRVGQAANPVLAGMRTITMWSMGHLPIPGQDNGDLFGWSP